LPKLWTIKAVSGPGSPVVPVPVSPVVGAPLLVPGADVEVLVSVAAPDEELDVADEAGVVGEQARSVARGRAARRMRVSHWL
jgi:hypothetical protein